MLMAAQLRLRGGRRLDVLVCQCGVGEETEKGQVQRGICATSNGLIRYDNFSEVVMPKRKIERTRKKKEQKEN